MHGVTPAESTSRLRRYWSNSALTPRPTRTRVKHRALINHRSRAPVGVNVRFRMNTVPLWMALCVLSPLPVYIFCILYFVVQVRRSKFGFKLTTGRFVGRVLLWSLVGFLGALALGIAFAAYDGGAQAVGILILLLPLGISYGVVAGTVRWRRDEAKPNPAPHRDGREASHLDQLSSAPARGRER